MTKNEYKRISARTREFLYEKLDNAVYNGNMNDVSKIIQTLSNFENLEVLRKSSSLVSDVNEYIKENMEV